MKIKSLLVGLASVGVAVSAFSQGQVNFLNGSTSLVQVDLGGGGSNVVNAPSSVYGTRVQLYYSLTAPTVASSAANSWDTTGWTAVSAIGTAVTAGGRFSVSSTLTIPGSVGGATVWLEAICWTGTANTAATAVSTLSSALQGGSEVGGYGWSQLVGDPAGTPPGTPVKTDASMNALGNLVLRPVPEPSTIALAGLGAASLLLFRRK